MCHSTHTGTDLGPTDRQLGLAPLGEPVASSDLADASPLALPVRILEQLSVAGGEGDSPFDDGTTSTYGQATMPIPHHACGIPPVVLRLLNATVSMPPSPSEILEPRSASKILGPRFSDLSGRSLSTEIQTAAHIVIVFIGEGRGAATASHACCHLDFGRRHDSPSPSPIQAGLRLVVLGSSSCRTYGGIPHSTGRFNMADSDLQLLHAAWLAMRQDVPRVRSRRSLSPNGAAGRSPNAGRARPGGAGWLDDKSLTHHVATEHEYPHGFRARLSGTGVSRDLPVVCRTRDGFRLVRVALPRQQVSVLARIGTPDLARPIGKGPTATIVNGWGCHGALSTHVANDLLAFTTPWTSFKPLPTPISKVSSWSPPASPAPRRPRPTPDLSWPLHNTRNHLGSPACFLRVRQPDTPLWHRWQGTGLKERAPQLLQACPQEATSVILSGHVSLGDERRPSSRATHPSPWAWGESQVPLARPPPRVPLVIGKVTRICARRPPLHPQPFVRSCQAGASQPWEATFLANVSLAWTGDSARSATAPARLSQHRGRGAGPHHSIVFLVDAGAGVVFHGSLVPYPDAKPVRTGRHAVGFFRQGLGA
ncbi:hypothetical protein Purlil1_5441 [Purpureocillium lilacinum]|uniref:Uncharacterized protein n=1 Tax=Purpureocillium lilacinum TaxID=33203 RepID=A0ABR0C234_PURLI|nr:hypothetical protein Purlil1_5441 [Purpureocillium lilacinum]